MNGGNRLVTPDMKRSGNIRSWLAPLVFLLMLTLAGSELHGQTGETSRSESSAEEETETADANQKASADRDVRARERAGESYDPTVKRLRKGTEAATEVSNPNVSPLAKAAAASSSSKKSVRSFTDSDLASAKGKIIRVEGSNVREPEIKPIEERSPEAVRPPQQDGAAKSKQLQRQIAAKALRTEISKLEKELRLLENDYYLIEEEDHREQLEKSFTAKQRALAEARDKLSDLESGGQ